MGIASNGWSPLPYSVTVSGEKPMTPTIVAETEVRKDSRNRVTLPGAEFDHYAVRAFADGHYELYPQVLVPATIDRGTLEMMDSAMENFDRGVAGEAIDPADMLAALKKPKARKAAGGRKRARG